MWYVLIEIALLLLLAVVLGIIIGWLLWKRGRAAISQRELEHLRTERADAQRERDLARRENGEMEKAMGAARRDRERLTASLADRDAALAERTALLHERTGELEDRDRLLEERDGMLATRDRAIAERDLAIAERDTAIADRDTALADRDNALSAHRAKLEEQRNRERLLVKERDELKAREIAAAKKAATGSPSTSPLPTASRSAAVGAGWIVPDTEVHRDDLTRISGIGPDMEAFLRRNGIWTFEQLAALTDHQVGDLQNKLTDFPDRIRQDNWVGQARELRARARGTSDQR